eukprot:CAMPEP_0194444014 /NCGR_PEP_ID=MMETSP0176-20130528/127029_1 /TAXON_ID=216777 /ORGANISM="Proboscia alata, Strain PI-D3" /LENGTH=116 /DNA_ID=CAMNT_0039270333 /DNA_START=643 /DNA_END=993 /DNA_ORIENTATION=+
MLSFVEEECQVVRNEEAKEALVIVEFYLEWTLQLLQVHGSQGCLSTYRGRYIRAMKSLHKVIAGKNEDLKKVCRENEYMLSFVEEECQVVRNEEAKEILAIEEEPKPVPSKRLRLE